MVDAPSPRDLRLRDALACPDRRGFLFGASSLAASLALPRIASAAGARDPRLVVIILRGALDGLSAVPPVGDPAYEALRPDISLKLAAEKGAALPLEGPFALNGAMTRFHALYKSGHALAVHATATGYRERSHFDGQDALENGTPVSRGSNTGWLNRAVAAIPSTGLVKPLRGLGVGAGVPLILQGPSPVMSWAPPRLDPAKADTVERLVALYAARDPELARAFEAGLEADRLASGGSGDGQSAMQAAPPAQRAFMALAQGCARLLKDEGGPRVAALSFDGWDTHIKEGSATGRLAMLLGGLDIAIDTLRTGLGDAWRETAVVVVTEFGRTARENGADGTDHGVGTAAFLAGGAVKGGRVMADWPGLKDSQLYEGRDLMPTTDLRAVLKGVLADHLGLPEGVLGKTVFPGSEAVAPVRGLIA